ncbi:protein of unknown function [Candidatus Nitrosocaldus cavascurensis]|uniref:Uncharacterized protein n=1 Tax=Candidatus Nitrosocaldus cavascurensis TaxID=2058097 RepID=A0A2K5ASF6_9ARCH|nr:protein of unknown function [Candidatus Nitrosocaldus cavascurensis]
MDGEEELKEEGERNKDARGGSEEAKDKHIIEHKGHDVICMRCNLLALEFIDYEKALKSKRPSIYARNKCLCIYKDEFYCNDCKVKITLDALT